jgi:neutral ceramidase
MISTGFARTTITPQTGLLMGGYRLRRGVALGAHEDLYATCAVLSDGHTEVALISLDLLCLPHEVVKLLKAGISAQANIAPENTLIACTHTHSGPGILGLSGESEANEIYLAHLPDIVSQLVVTAQQRLRHTKLYILQTDVPDVAFNRRIKLKDGSGAINIDKINPLDVQSVGVIDPCATALFFESGATTLGVIINFTLHPTVLGEKNYLYSRDYPGYLVDALHDQIPGQPLGLFFNGAFGNINQIKVPGEWISTYQEAQRIGEEIAGHILENRSRRTELENPTLTTTTMCIEISRRPAISTEHFDLTHAIRRRHEKKADQTEKAHLSPEKEYLFLQEALHLLDATYDLVELQIFRLGELEIVVLPGEIFVELGLEIKRRSNSSYSIVFGNANGYIGYVPTESSFNEGGYEIRLSLTSRLVSEAGEIILTQIDQLRMQK